MADDQEIIGEWLQKSLLDLARYVQQHGIAVLDTGCYQRLQAEIEKDNPPILGLMMPDNLKHKSISERVFTDVEALDRFEIPFLKFLTSGIAPYIINSEIKFEDLKEDMKNRDIRNMELTKQPDAKQKRKSHDVRIAEIRRAFMANDQEEYGVELRKVFLDLAHYVQEHETTEHISIEPETLDIFKISFLAFLESGIAPYLVNRISLDDLKKDMMNRDLRNNESIPQRNKENRKRLERTFLASMKNINQKQIEESSPTRKIFTQEDAGYQ